MIGNDWNGSKNETSKTNHPTSLPAACMPENISLSAEGNRSLYQGHMLRYSDFNVRIFF